MLRRFAKPLLLLALPILWASGDALGDRPDNWGFFGHRKINYMAVFTLPPEMMVFFKPHIRYLEAHAVDADMRRYATTYEAPRHFLDADHWGTYPFREIPRRWDEALSKYCLLYAVDGGGDTLLLGGHPHMRIGTRDSLWLRSDGAKRFFAADSVLVSFRAYRQLYRDHVLPNYYEAHWPIPLGALDTALQADGRLQTAFREAFVVDAFSEYGIVPYHLATMQWQLTEAFKTGDSERILRLCADFGHYIADAHVPLHTTENYNGQLTGQTGIHAFWESRLPELFAEDDYDFFVGKADYLDEPEGYFWQIVLDSHAELDSVLGIEMDLRQRLPDDQLFSYEQRGQTVVRTQSALFARRYHERMGGMVERRMRAAILAVGSAWYTAWVDAGQPDLRRLQALPEAEPEAPPLESDHAPRPE